jgi:3-hydroxyisobutyrate dehydrogenase-like beta-hydroxyacid dehydrogenase
MEFMVEPVKMGIIGLGKMGGIRAQTIRENDLSLLVSGTDPAPPARGFDDMQLLPDYQSVIVGGT